jgi:hypothetical protein
MIVISQPVNSGSRIGSAESLRVHIMVVVNHFLLGALIISELARVPEHVQNCFIQSCRVVAVLWACASVRAYAMDYFAGDVNLLVCLRR